MSANKIKAKKYKSKIYKTGQLSFIIACTVMGILVLVSLLYNGDVHEAQNLNARFLPPSLASADSTAHVLGTDQLGRDLAFRILAGIKTSFFIALLGTLTSAILGTLLGFVATKLKGIVEELIMMLVDIQASLPFILLAVALIMVLKNSFYAMLLILCFSGWGKYARLTRSLANSAMKHGYALAVHSLGASQTRVFFAHVLPNISSSLIVNMTLGFPAIMISESSLSFLGIGIQPPMVSLGRLLGEGRVYLSTAWWVAVFPGLIIFISSLAMTLIGDRLRDALGGE